MRWSPTSGPLRLTGHQLFASLPGVGQKGRGSTLAAALALTLGATWLLAVRCGDPASDSLSGRLTPAARSSSPALPVLTDAGAGGGNALVGGHISRDEPPTRAALDGGAVGANMVGANIVALLQDRVLRVRALRPPDEPYEGVAAELQGYLDGVAETVRRTADVAGSASISAAIAGELCGETQPDQLLVYLWLLMREPELAQREGVECVLERIDEPGALLAAALSVWDSHEQWPTHPAVARWGSTVTPRRRPERRF